MLRLYEAESNALNYIIIEDTEIDKSYLFTWDFFC